MIDVRAHRDPLPLLRWLPLVLIPVLLLASTYPGQYRVPAHYWVLALTSGVVFLAGARWPLAVSIALSVLAVPMLRTPAWGVSGLVPALGAVALVDVVARTRHREVVAVATACWAAAVVLGRVGLHDTSIGRASTAVEAAAYVGLPLLLGLYLRGQRDLAENLRLRAADAEARVRLDERAAMARELHDVVAHHMASIILRVSVAGRVVRAADPRVVAVLDDVRATAADALADIRRFLAALRDPALGTVSLVEADALGTELDAAVGRAKAAGFTVEADLDVPLGGLDAMSRLTLLRLVQESLTNVMKHAERDVPVRVRIGGGAAGGIDVEIVSGGTGSATAQGHGIVGMRERVAGGGGAGPPPPPPGRGGGGGGGGPPPGRPPHRRRRGSAVGGAGLAARHRARSGPAVITVLLVDDQRLVRAGLRMLIEDTTDLAVIGEAADGVEAVRRFAELAPDLVVMDLRMPGLDGVAATRQILAMAPRAKVLVLTTFDDDDHLFPALAAGAAGYFVKDTDPAVLLDAIRRTVDGDLLFSPMLLRRLVDRALSARAAPSPAPAPDLTPRELDVLRLVAAGYGNQEIAERLHLGVSTVKSHIANLLEKTGTDNRVRLAVYAVRHTDQ